MVRASWLDHASRAAFLRTLYPSGQATERVDLHEIRLHREGAIFQLTFDMLRPPAAMPAKWSKAGHSTIQVRLVGVGIRAVRHEGWGTCLPCDLSVAPAPGGVRLVVRGEQVDFEATVEALYVDHVSAYSQ